MDCLNPTRAFLCCQKAKKVIEVEDTNDGAEIVSELCSLNYYSNLRLKAM